MSRVQLFALGEAGPVPLMLPEGASSVHDAFDTLPLGTYTALRTFGRGRFLRLEDHLERLSRAIPMLGFEGSYDRSEVCRALSQVTGAYPDGDCRVRVDFLAAPVLVAGKQTRVVIGLSPLSLAPASYLKEGVGVEVAFGLRRRQPLAKTAAFVLERRPYPLYEQDRYEHLLVDEGENILEGSSSNFFAVLGHALLTPREGMLAGITRKVVLELAGKLGIPVRFGPLALVNRSSWAGAFLTSSARGLVPVVRIAGTIIGSGHPHALLASLTTAYESYVHDEGRPAI